MVRKQKITNSNPKELKEYSVSHQEIKYSGIIPPPNIIEGYERNCKGATDRILAMTENELKHNHELELLEQKSIIECRNKMLESEIASFKRGQFFGFILMLLALIGSFYLVLENHEIGGYATAIGTILFYFGSVIYKKKIQKQENKD